jgi:hypothetical protein
MGDSYKENSFSVHLFYATGSKGYIEADVCVQVKEMSGSMKDQNVF